MRIIKATKFAILDNMLAKIDSFLDRITMYRLVLSVLGIILVVSVILSFFGVLSFSPRDLLFSFLVFTTASWITNFLCGAALKIPTNFESTFITALILTLIVNPPIGGQYLSSLPAFALIALVATLSKYVLVWNKRHTFNPAAFGVVFAYFAIGWGTSWWVGNPYLTIPVLIGGILILRKLKQFHLILGFLASFVLGSILIIGNIADIKESLVYSFTASYLLFFLTIMLTEPLTMPTTRKKRILYGAFVGFLFIPELRLGSIVLGPELALLIGNLFSYLVSPGERYILKLKEKLKREEGIYDFIFKSNKKINHKPGQYLEWTIGDSLPDNRGNRRYFTIASSPTESDILLGARFYSNPSSFKRKLESFQTGDEVVAGKLSGEFVMPSDPSIKLAFIAGGIGITPFRSMIKYLLDTNERRGIVLIYSNNLEKEIAYKDILNEAESKLGIKTFYTLTGKASIPEGWYGLIGFVDKEVIIREIPDYLERVFYISGSHNMVTAFQKLLKELDVPTKNVKTDFFPGLV